MRSLIVALVLGVSSSVAADEPRVPTEDYYEFAQAIEGESWGIVRVIPDREQKAWMERTEWIRRTSPKKVPKGAIPMGRTVFKYDLENRGGQYKYDYIHPRYEVERGVLRFELGGLNAFELRDPMPLDTAVKNEFWIAVHKRYNEYWREPFWKDLLYKELSKRNREIYLAGRNALLSDEERSAELMAEIARMDKFFWKHVMDALREHAKGQGIEKILPYKRPTMRPLKLTVNESYAKVAKGLFGEDEIESYIYDGVDAMMWVTIPDWPVPPRSEIPKQIRPMGTYWVTHRLVHADRVPEEKRPAAKKATITSHTFGEMKKVNTLRGFNFLFGPRDRVTQLDYKFKLAFWYGLLHSYSQKTGTVLNERTQTLAL